MTDPAKLEAAARAWIALFDNDTYGTMHLSDVPEAVDLRAALEAEPTQDSVPGDFCFYCDGPTDFPTCDQCGGPHNPLVACIETFRTKAHAAGRAEGRDVGHREARDWIRKQADEWRDGASSVKGHHLPLKHVYRWLDRLAEYDAKLPEADDAQPSGQ
ncbi:MAG: hypothetical protein O7G84_00825 [Gammaproteobacteria bacterium]|nr:hypothetical protein [Gammaproteobacteria bacterium]